MRKNQRFFLIDAAYDSNKLKNKIIELKLGNIIAP